MVHQQWSFAHREIGSSGWGRVLRSAIGSRTTGHQRGLAAHSVCALCVAVSPVVSRVRSHGPWLLWRKIFENRMHRANASSDRVVAL
jgi:hypothetical protein